MADDVAVLTRVELSAKPKDRHFDVEVNCDGHLFQVKAIRGGSLAVYGFTTNPSLIGIIEIK
jgi:hypothetical protein